MDIEQELLDTEKMNEVELGQIEDMPIQISKKSANVIVKDLKRSVEKSISDQFAKSVKKVLTQMKTFILKPYIPNEDPSEVTDPDEGYMTTLDPTIDFPIKKNTALTSFTSALYRYIYQTTTVIGRKRQRIRSTATSLVSS